MPLTFLFLLFESSAETPLERYVDLMKNAPALSMRFSSSRMQGGVLYQPKVGLRFQATAPGLDYLQIQNAGKLTELDRIDKTYDTHDIFGIGRPDSRITSATGLFPTWIFAGDFRKMVPPNATLQEKGTQSIGGKSGTRYHYRDQGGQGEFTDVDLVIESTGRPLKVHLSGSSMSGAYDMAWTFTRFEPVPGPASSRFQITIPDGFMPFSTDTVYSAFTVGEKLPKADWVGNDGKPLDPLSRLPKGGLIAILGSESEPSRASLKSIERIKKAGMAVVILADAKSSFAEGYGSDAVMRKLGIAATPHFFRVSADGTIEAAWMGYDAADAASFEEDVRSGK